MKSHPSFCFGVAPNVLRLKLRLLLVAIASDREASGRMQYRRYRRKANSCAAIALWEIQNRMGILDCATWLTELADAQRAV